MGTLNWDILELARRLRFERLFVSSEQQHLQVLNDKVKNVISFIFPGKKKLLFNILNLTKSLT